MIRTNAELLQAIEKVVSYSISDEEDDYELWKDDNPGCEDSQHIVHTLRDLAAWITGVPE